MGEKTDGLEKIIADAYSVVQKSNIAEEHLQAEAFRFALSYKMASTGWAVDNPEVVAVSGNRVEGKADGGLESLAQGLGISYDLIDLIFAIEDDRLILNLPSKLFPNSTSAAMREIAVLLTVGRKHARLGNSTPFELIRLACDEHAQLDTKNFASSMNGLKPRLVPTGKGSSKELIAKKPADDWATELINKYANVK